MKRQATLVSLIASFAVPKASAGVALYGPSPYRQKSDSPFYAGLQAGTLYFEDFEDGQLSTPNVHVRNGAPALSQGVDEDDGVLDNRGNDYVWYASGSRLPEYGPKWAIEITFTSTPDEGYPKYAGMVVPGFSRFPADFSSIFTFRAYDGQGNDVTGDVEVELVHLPPSTPFFSTEGDQFIGIHSDNGISKILLGTGAFDHLQYGYTIPESGTAALFGFASVWLLSVRRRIRGR